MCMLAAEIAVSALWVLYFSEILSVEVKLYWNFNLFKKCGSRD